MKRVFETAECEAVRNSIFWELRYESTRTKWKLVAIYCLEKLVGR